MQSITNSFGLLQFIQKHQSGGGLKGGSCISWWNPLDNIAGTTQCAEWSNGLLRKNGYGVYGNAWSITGAKPIYNGYAKVEKPKVINEDTLNLYNQTAADNFYKNFKSSTLDKSKPYIVNMTRKGSSYTETAYRDGKKVAGSHTGILTWEGDRWKVTHNIGGWVRQDDFFDLQQPGKKTRVTAVYSLKK